MNFESKYIEFKTQLTDELEKDVVAFLNTQGGIIYNDISEKTARYSGLDRIDLIENHEFGYCLLDKATKQLLEKAALENRTVMRITAKEWEEKRLWNEVALREAIINAIVYNDYMREMATEIESFAERIEITLYGSLSEGLNKEEFFQGFSGSRNKEIMRIYKDFDLVEQLESGVPLILQAYDEKCFYFSENFIRMIFPTIQQTTSQVTDLLNIMEGEMNWIEMQNKLNLQDRKHFFVAYLQPALENEFIAMKFPKTPNNPRQRYCITEKEQNFKANKKQ
jgi:predicted HTH transcriptional regulator